MNEKKNIDTNIILSICIATRNRAAFILETLDSIVSQDNKSIEIVIVDGGSEDDTRLILSKYNFNNIKVKLIFNIKNNGVDADFDAAILAASGKYCWLFSDDDLMKHDSLNRILKVLEINPDVVAVNSNIYDEKFEHKLKEKVINLPINNINNIDSVYFFSNIGSYLSFIGGLIIRRDYWISRERSEYWGSEFAHVGVIFQKCLNTHFIFINEPLISIRYGNSGWSSRAYLVWLINWPNLIMSLNFSYDLKLKVSGLSPFILIKTLLLFKAINILTFSNFIKYRECFYRKNLKIKITYYIFTFLILLIPNFLLKIFLIIISYIKNDKLNLYRLCKSSKNKILSKYIYDMLVKSDQYKA